jgi:hypothetical protein
MLIVAVGAGALPQRLRTWALWMGLASLMVTGTAFCFLLYAPRDYMVRYPALQTVLHPYLIALYASLALILGGGILTGIAGRKALSHLSSAGSHHSD